MSKKLFFIIFNFLFVVLVFTSIAHSMILYERENHYEKSPIFYLTIFPKDVKDQENYYFNRALEYFTMKEYELSLEKIEELLTKYPETKFKEYATFLKADNEFYMMLQNGDNDLSAVLYTYQDAIDTYPDSKYNPWANFQIANCYYRMGFLYEAEAKYDNFMEQYPNNVHYEDAMIYKAELIYNASKYTETIKMLNTFNERYPDSKYKYVSNYFIGDSYYKQGDKKSGYDYFNRAKGIEKEDPDKAMYYSKILMDAKDYSQAIYNLTSVINYFPKYHDKIKTYALLAESFLMQKDYNNSVSNYFYIIKKYPDSIEAVESRLKIVKIRSMVGEKRFNIVMKSSDADFILDLKKVYADVYNTNKGNKYGQLSLYELGGIAIKQNNDLRAMKIYKKLYDEYPGGDYEKQSLELFLELFNKLVKHYYSQKESIKIVEMYQRYKKDIKDSKGEDISGVLYYIGKSLKDMKLFSLAFEVFDRIRAEDKSYNTEEIIYLCALTAYGSDQHEMSEKYSNEILTGYKKSNYLDEMEYVNTKSVYHLKKYEEAVDLLEKYLNKKRKTTDMDKEIELLSDLSDAYDKTGNISKAILYNKRILEISKKQKDDKYKELEQYTILRLAGLSYISRKYSYAVNYYEQFLKNKTLTEDDNMPLFYLAKSYQNDDDIDSALIYYNKLLENSDRGFYARSAKEEIKYLEFIKVYEDMLQ